MTSRGGLTVMNYYLLSFFPIYEPNLYIVIYSSPLSLYLSTMLVLLMLIFSLKYDDNLLFHFISLLFLINVSRECLLILWWW